METKNLQKYHINYGPCETGIKTEVVEKKYNAKYIGDFALKTRDGSWANQASSIFWQETPPVDGYSNYFAIFTRDGHVYITCGKSAFSEPITGIVGSDGEVLYSRFRWDFRSLKTGEGSIDGGRDYCRMLGGKDGGGFARRVELVIEGPELVVQEPASELV